MKRPWFVAALCICTGIVATAVPRAAIQAGKNPAAHPKTWHVNIVRDSKTVGRYAPGTLVVRRGDRVMFRNVSAAPHTVSATNGSFDSGTIYVGKSWTYTARKPGTFSYFCQFHAFMHGKIIVKAR